MIEIRGDAGMAVLRLAMAALGLAAAVRQPGSVAPAPQEAAEHGRDLYRIYCADCHGPAGEGDGPSAARLTVRPPDLTVLVPAGAGAFPLETVRSAIDGRTALPGHERGGMPIWGLAFQDPGSDADQEREVRTHIDWLLEFLKSIQRPASARSVPDGR